MKKILAITMMLALVATSAMAAGGSKQSSSSATESGSSSMSGTTSGMSGAGVQDQAKASKLIGSEVKNTQGQNLGKISDLAIDPQSGQIAFAVLSHGGTLGIGEKYTAVPFNALQVDAQNKVTLNISKDRLASAPSFGKNDWPSLADRSQLEETYRFYGVTPYWESGSQMQRSPSDTGSDMGTSGTMGTSGSMGTSGMMGTSGGTMDDTDTDMGTSGTMGGSSETGTGTGTGGSSSGTMQ